jgi:hypothetical protein
MLHMDHSEFSGLPRMIKSATDRVVSAVALLLASHNPRITGLTYELAEVTLKLQPNPWLVSVSMARPGSLTPEEVELPVFLGTLARAGGPVQRQNDHGGSREIHPDSRSARARADRVW